MVPFLRVEPVAVDDDTWYDFTTDVEKLRHSGMRFKENGTAGFRYDQQMYMMTASALMAGSNGDEIQQTLSEVEKKAAYPPLSAKRQAQITKKSRLRHRLLEAVLSIAKKLLRFF